MTIRLPKHKCGLYLAHNAHRDYYQSAAEWFEFSGDEYNWVSEKEREKAMAANEVWTLTWYPETPVGGYALAASSLAALLKEAATYPEDETYCEEIE